jgi:hypothetical protein
VLAFRSESSPPLVSNNPGQPGVALRQLRAPGRGATAPAVDRCRRRGRPPSRRIWAGRSPGGSSITARISPFRVSENFEPGSETSGGEREPYPPASVPGSVCAVLLADSVASAVLRRCHHFSFSGWDGFRYPHDLVYTTSGEAGAPRRFYSRPGRPDSGAPSRPARRARTIRLCRASCHRAAGGAPQAARRAAHGPPRSTGTRWRRRRGGARVAAAARRHVSLEAAWVWRTHTGCGGVGVAAWVWRRGCGGGADARTARRAAGD